MLVAIHLDAEDAPSLHAWLRADPELRRKVSLNLLPAPAGSMGAGEVIQAVLDHGETLMSLALAYAAWRHPRRGNTTVTFTVRDRSVTVENGSPEAIRAIAELLEEGPGGV